MKPCRSCGKRSPRALFDGMCGECSDEYYALVQLRRQPRQSRLTRLLRRMLRHGLSG